jgi:histidyl-tRNA synthetase
MEKQRGSLPAVAGGVFVVAIGDEARGQARALVRELRHAGVPAEASLEERPLKAQLKMADRTGASVAAIVGEQELRDGVVTVRKMADGTQKQVEREELVAWLSR